MKLAVICFVVALAVCKIDGLAIGGNVAGVDYRARTHGYLNLIRQAQSWMSLQNSSTLAQVDEHGWPQVGTSNPSIAD
jgi:hypothetical protein